MNIPIVYEDDAILVLNKPAGITVNNSDTTAGVETVQDFTEEYLGMNRLTNDQKESLVSVDEKGYKNAFFDRGGIVHRLDKETSGLLLVAKEPDVFLQLQKQFHDRVVHKTYLALVHGHLTPSNGEVSIPVDRLPWDRKKFGIVPGGRPSVTRYTVLKSFTLGKKKEQVSLVELYPETGRTHQIRVHMKYLNHPIFADFLYAGRKTSREDRKVVNRVFLHAHKISFMHPISGEEIHFEVPLPPDLASVLQDTLAN